MKKKFFLKLDNVGSVFTIFKTVFISVKKLINYTSSLTFLSKFFTLFRNFLRPSHHLSSYHFFKNDIFPDVILSIYRIDWPNNIIKLNNIFFKYLLIKYIFY